MTCNEIGNRLPHAFVGHMQDVHAGQGLEQFSGQMRRRADACGRIFQLSGPCLRQRQQVFDIVCRHGRVHSQHEGTIGSEAYRREVSDDVVGDVFIQRGRDGHCPRAVEQGVAVWCRRRDSLRADDATRAGAVLDNHVLPQVFREAVAQSARGQIIGAARWIGDDNSYRLRRIGLCVHLAPAARNDNTADEQSGAEAVGGIHWHGHV